MIKRVIVSTLVLLRRNKLRTVLLCVGLLTTSFAFALGSVLTTNFAVSAFAPYSDFPVNAMVVRSVFRNEDGKIIEDFDTQLKYCFYSVSEIPNAIVFEDTAVDVKIFYTQKEFIDYPVLSCEAEDALEQTRLVTGRNFLFEDSFLFDNPALIHRATATFLFGEESPLGQKIQLGNGLIFTIVGVLEDTPDIQRTLTRQERHSFGIFTLASTTTWDYAVCVADGSIGTAYAEKLNHHLTGETASYCRITTHEGISIEQNQLEADARKSLYLLSGVMYVVCTIFIFSIMLFFVKERVTEIGIRLSIGAQAKDISFQFLLEMAVLSLISGVAGTILGVFWGSVLSYMLTAANGMTYVAIPSTAYVLPTLLSLTMALLASLIPSVIASRLTIKECLQFE